MKARPGIFVSSSLDREVLSEYLANKLKEFYDKKGLVFKLKQEKNNGFYRAKVYDDARQRVHANVLTVLQQKNNGNSENPGYNAILFLYIEKSKFREKLQGNGSFAERRELYEYLRAYASSKV